MGGMGRRISELWESRVNEEGGRKSEDAGRRMREAN